MQPPRAVNNKDNYSPSIYCICATTCSSIRDMHVFILIPTRSLRCCIIFHLRVPRNHATYVHTYLPRSSSFLPSLQPQYQTSYITYTRGDFGCAQEANKEEIVAEDKEGRKSVVHSKKERGKKTLSLSLSSWCH